MERWGQLIDRATAGLTDPAELFAVGTRISGRLGWIYPDIAGFLTGMGLDALDIPGGLAPRALRDIEAGQPAPRFASPIPKIALSAVARGLLGLLRMCQRHPERVTEATVDQLAEAELRLLGVPADEAARLTALLFLPLRLGDSRDDAVGRLSRFPGPAMNQPQDSCHVTAGGPLIRRGDPCC